MFSPLLIPLIAAMFLAINMGGSGTAPSFTAAYGSNIVRKDLIPGLFGLFVFIGAIIAGKEVVKTISRGLLPGSAMTRPVTTIILLSTASSMFLANLLKVPQSTSQATVGALVGAAVYFGSLKTGKLFFEILPTWFILPFVSLLLTFCIGRFLWKPVRKRNMVDFRRLSRNHAFRFLVILASCYVAFAIGSNNVANASGPLTSMLLNEFGVGDDGSKLLLCMILGALIVAPCFTIGSSIFGERVLETTGKEIINFGPLGAMLISFVTASLLLLASVTRGIPTSLVQLNVGAVIGLGICKVGTNGVLAKTSVRKILTVWIVAPLISLLLSGFFCFVFDRAGSLH